MKATTNTDMERKYMVMLCCLALLILTGVCFAGTTPWPKYPLPRTYSYHFYINNPNAQGCNGEGDSALCLHLSTDFWPCTQIVGINVGIHDFDFGNPGGKMKAMEIRYENPNTPGCPDWTAAGKLSEISPVPYVSNWADCDQYMFTAPGPVVTPQPNIICVVQYMPGLGPGAGTWPLVGCDGGPGSGFHYFWDASTCSCFGPMGVNWWMCFYGNAMGLLNVDVVLTSNWHDTVHTVRTSSDKTAMNQGKGLRMTIAIQNGTGMLYGPIDLSLWARGGNRNYAGYSGTGLDMIDAMSGGTKKNPYTILIPSKGAKGAVKLSGLVGKIFEYGFSAFTLEGILDEVPHGGTVTRREFDDALFCPIGAVDDNSAEAAYYVQYPQVWGDGFAKRFIKDNMPVGPSTLQAVEHSIWDFSGATRLLYRADIRSEGTYGPGTPDTSPAGLLGTFDPACAPFSPTLARRACYDTLGNPGIPLPPDPKGNIYVKWDLDPVAWPAQAIGSSTGGCSHKQFGQSSYVAGGNEPYTIFNSECIVRMLITAPLDACGVSGTPALATTMPRTARAK